MEDLAERRVGIFEKLAERLRGRCSETRRCRERADQNGQGDGKAPPHDGPLPTTPDTHNLNTVGTGRFPERESKTFRGGKRQPDFRAVAAAPALPLHELLAEVEGRVVADRVIVGGEPGFGRLAPGVVEFGEERPRRIEF